MLDELMILLCEQYRELPLNANGTQNIRVKTLGEWFDKNINTTDYSGIFSKIVSEFKPTATVSFPMISHVREILNINPDKEKKEEAQNIADRIIEAVNKCGYNNPDAARKYIGELGWRVLHEGYGNWLSFSTKLLSEQVEITRAHIRDSAIALNGKDRTRG